VDQPKLAEKLMEAREIADKLGLKDTAMLIGAAWLRCGWEALELSRQQSSAGEIT
jgi:hypothetical protein